MDYNQPDEYYQRQSGHSPSRPPRTETNSIPIPGHHSYTHDQMGPDFYPPPPGPPPNMASQHPAQSKPIIADAVNQAFDNSAAANQVPAEVIAQITEQVRSQVIDTLRKELNPSTIPGPPAGPPPQYNTSGGLSSSPRQAGIWASQEAHRHSPASFSDSQQSASRHYSGGTGRSGESPVRVGVDDRDHPLRGSFDASRRDTRHDSFAVHERDHDQPAVSQSKLQTEDKGSRTREPPLKEKEDLSQHTGDRGRKDSDMERPVPNRLRTDDEETVIEKMWQPLFSGSDRLSPTPRLSQFLRGLALHLNENYEPKNSLVVGPFKMKRLFKEMRVPDDFIPWEDIFQMRSVHLSALYTRLMCQHHLIPKSSIPYEKPHLAALTPDGFASFMTLLIQAYPDIEFGRLTMTLKEWPVSNADERKERWPKELSRRLLPKSSSEHHRSQLMSALHSAGIDMSHCHPAAKIPEMQNREHGGRSEFYPSSAPSGYVPPPPPATAPPQHSRSHSFKAGQGERETFAARNQARDNVSDNGSEASSSPSVVIERERKPYIAKEGTGKIYEESRGHHKSGSNEGNNGAGQARDNRHHSTAAPTSSTNSHGRDRGYSAASADTHPTYKQTSRTRSPPREHHARASGDRVDTVRDSHSTRRTDDRHYVEEPDSCYSERARHERYREYDQEYRNMSSAPSHRPDNPPLGTGERRY